MCSGIFNKLETSVEIQITLGSFFYNIYSFCKLSFSFNRIKISRVYIFFLCNYVIYKSFSRDLLALFFSIPFHFFLSVSRAREQFPILTSIFPGFPSLLVNPWKDSPSSTSFSPLLKFRFRIGGQKFHGRRWGNVSLKNDFSCASCWGIKQARKYAS